VKIREGGQCTYWFTLWLIRVTSFAMETQRNKTGCYKAANMVTEFYSTYLLLSAAATSTFFLSYLQNNRERHFSFETYLLRIEKPYTEFIGWSFGGSAHFALSGLDVLQSV
jgi:hypothetical protein